MSGTAYVTPKQSHGVGDKRGENEKIQGNIMAKNKNGFLSSFHVIIFQFDATDKISSL